MRTEPPWVFAGIKGGSVAARAVKAGADVVLNHVDRGARATLVYQRYEFDAEKRMAPDRWAVKGGLALETRLGDRARVSLDLDADHPRSCTLSLERTAAVKQPESETL